MPSHIPRLVVLLIGLLGVAQAQTVRFVDAAVSIEEGGTAQVTVEKTGASTDTINIVIEFENENSDFVANSKVVTFQPSTSSLTRTLSFTSIDDTEPEAAEIFMLSLRVLAGNAQVGNPDQAQITIRANDDAFGVIGFDVPSPVYLTEHPSLPTPVSLALRRDAGLFGSIVVTYQISGGPNAASNDLSPVTSTVTFQEGESAVSLDIIVLADNIPENEEVFTIALISVSGGARLNDSSLSLQLIIEENDSPVRFAQPLYNFNEDAGSVSVEVLRGLAENGMTRLGPIDGEVTVSYYLTASGAVFGVDFVGTNGSITFASGETRMSINIGILPDEVPEVGEDFTITLINPSSNAVLVNPSSTVGRILANDDHNGVLSFNSSGSPQDLYVVVDEETTRTVNDFVVIRSGGTFGEVTIAYQIVRNDSGSSSTPESSGIVRLADGQSSQELSIPIPQDDNPEEAEVYLVQLLPDTVTGGARVDGIIEGTLVVRDSDDVYGVIQFSSDNDQSVVVNPLPRRLQLLLTRAGGTVGDVAVTFNVTYTLPNGMAEQSNDLLDLSGGTTTLFLDGNSVHQFVIPIRSDAFLSLGAQFDIILESVELISPTPLLPPSSPRLGSKVSVSLPVAPDIANGEIGFDQPGLSLDVSEPAGPNPLQVVLNLTREGTAGEATVYWRIIRPSAPVESASSDDYGLSNGSVAFAAGEAMQYLITEILPDDIAETDETFVVELYDVIPQNQLLRSGDTTATITILENDNPGGIFSFSARTAGPFTITEGGEVIQIVVERYGGSLVSRSVMFDIEGGVGGEFYGASGVADFGPGVTTYTITLAAVPDNIPELNETFRLILSPFGTPPSKLGNRTVVDIMVLINDDPYGVVQFADNPATIYIDESTSSQNQTAQFAVVRSRGTFGDASVSWVVMPASSAFDVRPTQGVLNFAEGESVQYIALTAQNDQIPEGSERFTISLLNPTGGSRLGDPVSATLNINKNDDAVFFEEPVNVTVAEPGTVTLTVRRNRTGDSVATVDFRTVPGTALSSRGDYAETSGQLSFPVGVVMRTITLEILDDTEPEDAETFTVELFNPVGDIVVYGAAVATITIEANDDPGGVFGFQGPLQQAVSSEESVLNFVVRRERGAFGTVKVNWQLFPNGSSVPLANREDFEEVSGFVEFSSGQIQGTVTLRTLADGIPEFSEFFELVLVNTSGGGRLSDSLPLTASIEITENDDPYGVLAFASASREKDVAEDFYTGDEDRTRATFTVQRLQGTFGSVGAVWELYSDAVSGNLPTITDLLFLGEFLPNTGVSLANGEQRPYTGTPVYSFNGQTLAYMTIPRVYHPSTSDTAAGFSLSAWVRPTVGSNGFIISKVSSSSAEMTYYGLKLQIQSQTVTYIELTYSTTSQTNLASGTSLYTLELANGEWHFIVATIDNQRLVANMYVDGAAVGGDVNLASAVLDGDGEMYVGAARPGNQLYTGFLQDVRIYSSVLQDREMEELQNSPVTKDVRPISGTVTFGPGVTSADLQLTSVQDVEEEGNEVFTLSLMSARGGAALSGGGDVALVTVLKSDNANGLFGFAGPCTSSNTSSGSPEAVQFTCDVIRSRGDQGVVTIPWDIRHQSTNQIAVEDFVNATGVVVFQNGVREQTFTFRTIDDMDPETLEQFTVTLVSDLPLSDDGVIGSTNTSGASIDPTAATNEVAIPASDNPHGLLQFSAGPPPNQSDPLIPPMVGTVVTRVQEEGGVARLLVVRAQGLLGDITVEWRTVDGTAVSAGKNPVDFMSAGGTLTFTNQQRYAYIDINIVDNDVAELEKSFLVQLSSPTGGAEIGPGSTIDVIIEPSDNAYGTFDFASQSLFVTAEEPATGSASVTFQVVRLGGALDEVTLYWSATSDPSDPQAVVSSDLMNSSGNVTFAVDQRAANIQVAIQPDNNPELDELFNINLIDVTNGQIGNASQAVLSVLANDDPYGVFVISEQSRVIMATENSQTVTMEIYRSQGTQGIVQVSYATLNSGEELTNLPAHVRRATENEDFEPTQGTVTFAEGQQTANVTVRLLDDTEPETEESVFVYIVSTTLVSGGQQRPVADSPRVGTDNVGEIKIIANDNANGVLALSASQVIVMEGQTQPVINVTRSAGTFGTVTVKFQTIPETAVIGVDYSVTSTDVILYTGETSKPLPLEIINDQTPETAETFRVVLLEQITGGAVLGSPDTAEIIIEQSDDPYGNFGFGFSSQVVTEPDAGGTRQLTLSVIRSGGTIGVVAVEWQATINGQLAVDDVFPTGGTLYFLSNDITRIFTLNVMADDVPEERENVILELVNVTGGGVIGAQSQATIIIEANDDPHGVVQFTYDDNLVREIQSGNNIAGIRVERSGGNFGTLEVTYSTETLDVIEEAIRDGQTILSYYQSPIEGSLQVNKIQFDVSRTSDPLRTCAETCLGERACGAFEYTVMNTTVLCLLTVSTGSEGIDSNSGFMLYIKDNIKTQALYASQAISGVDYVPIVGGTFLIGDRASFGFANVTVLDDALPEQDESFGLRLQSVRVLYDNPLPVNLPTLGDHQNTRVTIENNDDANGIWRLYSSSPEATENGQRLSVEEQPGLSVSVELIVERGGGNIGEVTVAWRVAGGTATSGLDYSASGGTLTFVSGQIRQVINVGIRDDDIPEIDETITAELYNPGGGSILGPQSNVTLTILANDFVAGILRFSTSSYIISEGETFNVTVDRSSPGLGTVTVDWSIQSPLGLDPALSFRQTNNTITFESGELSKVITLESLPDETPETNENFQVVLSNVQTTGVSQPGAAAIDPQGSSSSITIGASDEPHGVFSFAQGSLSVTTPEGNRTVQLFVDRKYGAIGVVRVSYSVSMGAVDPSTPATERAEEGQDFLGVNGSLDFSDGSSSEAIVVQINEDNIPELDEVFLVTLNGVELIGAIDVNTPPKLDVTDLVSEITITANDGTQGVVRFDTASTSLDVSEDVGTVEVTILRDRGTYGEVSVFIYSQNIGAFNNDDYRFTEQTLVFANGESTRTVTVEIINDAIPEDAETLELILNNPTGGLELGEPARLIINILPNDDAFGVVYFVGNVDLTISEPGATSTGDSVARFPVFRDRGTFGQIDVPFEVIGGENDLSPTTGFVTFGPGAQAAVLSIGAVSDDIPELNEKFRVVLREPTGGATLGSLINGSITIEENDAPYGSMQIFPLGSRLPITEVEESAGATYFTVERGGGNIGNITVDVATRPGTAIAPVGDVTVLGTTQNITGVGVRSWHPITANGQSYLVLISDARTGPLTSGLNSDGSEGQPDSGNVMTSMLYKWQGVFVPVQTIETDGAVKCTSTVVAGTTLIAIANMGSSGRRQTTSRIYRLNANSSLTVIQDITTVGASDVEFVTVGSDTYLAITQQSSNTGQSLSTSLVYLWNGITFVQSSVFTTNGASAVDGFTIAGNQYLAVANYYDSSLASYEIMSVVYEWQAGSLVQVQQLSTLGATDIQAFSIGSNDYLAVANSRNNVGNTNIDSVIYQWSSVTSQFVLHQSIPTLGAQSIRVFVTSDGNTHLAIANANGPSSVYTWNAFNSQFDLELTSDPAYELVPVDVTGRTDPLLAAANFGDGSASEMSVIYQMTDVGSDADYVPWSTQLTFEPSDTELTFAVSIIDDTMPEDDQTFAVYLSNPTGGAELGTQSETTVIIISNDDAHGIIAFTQDDLAVQAEERSMDMPEVLTVERLGGTAGLVVVEWQATGQLEATDIRPLTGQIEFPDGVSTAPLVLTVLADDAPELDETSTIQLTRIINPGTTRTDRGAVISPSQNAAQLTILANDSPHGVFAWNVESLYTAVDEPEGSQRSRSVTLFVTREQGFAGMVNVYYSTSEAAGLPSIQRAQSGSDFTSVQSFVTFGDGVNSASVTINILPDTDAEGPETFFVNLTSVELVSGQLVSGAEPSIRNGQNVAEITVRQNDNANGILQLDVTKNADGDVEVYEGSGTSGILNLPVSRTAGAIGTVGVSWSATPVSASTADFSPQFGNVTLIDGQRAATISINIVDDTIYEDDERFTVSLHTPVGGAVLGSETSIIVKILKNDSPKGLFGFAFTQESVSESGGQVSFTVERTQGTQGTVEVRWEVEAAGRDDLTPSSGTLEFQQGDTRKSIILEAVQDNILEGEERFTISITSVTVDAEISPVYGTADVVILANPNSAGIVSILPGSRDIMIGEPTQNYNGQAMIHLTRGDGIFGEVTVNWQINPAGDNTFMQTSGQVVFQDLQQNATITLQTIDDSTPELKRTYTLVLASITGGASIDTSSGGNQATIQMVASDNPFGIFEFDLPAQITVSEDSSQVTVSVVRNAGIFGTVQVSYTTAPDVALGGIDYSPSSGVLTFSQGVDSLDINIAILQDSLPEGPEAFFVNLTAIQLLDPVDTDYTFYNGLQPDIPPVLGVLSIKTVIIEANDNAEGVIEFDKTLYEVQEGVGVAQIPVVRSFGNFGIVSATYVVESLTASPGGVDFLLSDGTITFADGQSQAAISVTIIDDTVKEFSESFNIRLTGTAGGALLGSNLTATVVISKSDGPDGLIGFAPSNLDRVIANPQVARDLTFTIELTGGLDQYLTGAEVRWRILGPNSNSVLQETEDISTPAGFLQGSVTFDPVQRGSRTFDLRIKPYVGPEVQEVFIVEIYQVVGAGEVDAATQRATLTVLKHGDPNGIVQFTADSLQPRYFSEPSDDSPSLLVAFPLLRREGLVGDVQVQWEVRDSNGQPITSDVSPTNGTVDFPESIATSQILLGILPDTTPELEEGFMVVLVSALGGAEIDGQFNTSRFFINPNDDPHGVFSVRDESQTIVLSGNNRRRLRLDIQRNAGTVGNVQVNYELQYNDGITGAYVPSSGSVTCSDGESTCVERVSLLNNDVFLAEGTAFTVNLTSVNYLGPGTPTIQPSIDPASSSATIVVPGEVANSFIGFSQTGIFVNDETNEVTLTVERIGSYGDIDITWRTGYKPGDLPAGYMDGMVTPATGQVRLVQGEAKETFTVTLSSTGVPSELFAVHIETVFSNIAGGAEIRSGYETARIDPYGVIGFAENSREVTVQESDQQVTLVIERTVGTLGSVRVTYTTIAGTASPGVDYTEVTTGAVTLNSMEQTSTIIVPLLEDPNPEIDQTFFVNITSVQRLPIDTDQGASPRLNSLHSTALVIIQGSNDPYGVLSITPRYREATEADMSSKTLTFTVQRTGGSFGTIRVKARTVGGGESWQAALVDPLSNGSTTIGGALAQSTRKSADVGMDYELLEEEIIFNEGETSTDLYLTIYTDDVPEPDEVLFLYLTDPEGGARIAGNRIDIDGNRRGYSTIVILGNDNYNGIIGFDDNSLYVTVYEDVDPTVVLTLDRGTAFFENVTVSWRAVLNQNGDLTGGIINLFDQLTEVTGQVMCEAGQRSCDLPITLSNDEEPEFAQSFLVELTGVGEGASLDTSRRFANVTMADSDYPNGLLQFAIESRFQTVDSSAMEVSLTVERVGGTSKTVRVGWSTSQLQSPTNVAGVTLYPAIGGAEFDTRTSNLNFAPGQRRLPISVMLTPDNPSSSADFPKQFQVRLTSANNGASLESTFGTASITIVQETASVDIWDTWYTSLTDTSNTGVYNVLQSLAEHVRLELTSSQLSVVIDTLNNIIAEGYRRPLANDIHNQIMSIFCTLMVPTRSDSRGVYELAESFTAFSYTLVTGTECETLEPRTMECDVAKMEVARWLPDTINGHRFDGKGNNFFTLPTDLLNVEMYGRSSDNPRCEDVHFIEYSSQQWFYGAQELQTLNREVISVGIKGAENNFTNLLTPVQYRIYTTDARVTPLGASCILYNGPSKQWLTNFCSVSSDNRDYVECSCNHLSEYAAQAQTDNLVGYNEYVFASCFICIGGLFLAIIAHHFCAVQCMFAAKLLLHMCFACMALQIIFVTSAYVSNWVSVEACASLGVLMHYFFLAQFTWMLVQSINFWKVFVMNDEHTDRFYILYFVVGWSLPVVVMVVYVVIVYAAFQWAFFLDQTETMGEVMYGDVHGNGDICFMPNGYAAMASAMAPAFLCLLAVIVVLIQSYQVKPQWKRYDDVYQGSYNTTEYKLMLVFWLLISLTWLWGGLHMAYSQLWQLILFCIFNIAQGLYAFLIYTVLRNQICKRPSQGNYTLNEYDNGGLLLDQSHTYSTQNLISLPPEKGSKGTLTKLEAQQMIDLAMSQLSQQGDVEWDRQSIHSHHSHHSAAILNAMAMKPPSIQGSNLYSPSPFQEVLPPPPPAPVQAPRIHPSPPLPPPPPPADPPRDEDDTESQDFDDLIFALKTGGAYNLSESSPQDRPKSRASSTAPSQSWREPSIPETDHISPVIDRSGDSDDHYQMRRINIADTHL